MNETESENHMGTILANVIGLLSVLGLVFQPTPADVHPVNALCTEILAVPESDTIHSFETILQNPELPTGCEITAMTMVLNYYGFAVDKMTMAKDYLPTEPDTFYYKDGRYTGPDMEYVFVGDPTGTGYICGTPAITKAANDFILSTDTRLHAVDKNGITPEELYTLISRDVPVVVWVTLDMAPRKPVNTWYTDTGKRITWAKNDHAAVLIGYSPDTVTIADPMEGCLKYPRAAFEEVFASRGNQCVILEQIPEQPKPVVCYEKPTVTPMSARVTEFLGFIAERTYP